MPEKKIQGEAAGPRRQKISVLGGGAGALSAVFALTSVPGWEEKYDITVYQLGWRLGGKGASSRQPDRRGRNLEHGLHVLGGFYHNSFKLLRECYAEWEKVSPHAIAFDKAFIPHNEVALGQKDANGWQIIPIPFPSNSKKPGIGATELSLKAFIQTMFDWIKSWFGNVKGEGLQASENGLLSEGIERIEALFDGVSSIDFPDFVDDAIAAAAVSMLDELIGIVHLAAPLNKVKTGGINYWILIEIALVCARGMFEDKVTKYGFDCINDHELLDWLKRHGGSKAMLESSYTRAGYDYVFAYEKGDTRYPSLAAGVGIKGFMRLTTTYHGSIFWHMNGGMGEIVFTPLYEVLKARGVKFRFFHKVEELRLDDNRMRLSEIRGTLQAVPLAGDDGYDPMFDYEGRKVWPSRPFYAQLKDGAALEAANEDFESAWAPEGKDKFTLRQGEDFDLVVLGISVGALETICADLVDRIPIWKDMIQNMETVATIGAQFWGTATSAEAGWPLPPSILTAYEEPLATWADMSYLLAQEQVAEPAIANLSYYCGSVPMPVIHDIPPGSSYPKEATRQAEAFTLDWVHNNMGRLWPNASGPDGKLSDTAFVDSYVQMNVNPSDRYVLSRPGTIHTRLTADGSGVSNLYLAGDWLKNGADAGFFEGGVMGGLQCSRAICGYPQTIVNEKDHFDFFVEEKSAVPVA